MVADSTGNCVMGTTTVASGTGGCMAAAPTVMTFGDWCDADANPAVGTTGTPKNKDSTELGAANCALWTTAVGTVAAATAATTAATTTAAAATAAAANVTANTTAAATAAAANNTTNATNATACTDAASCNAGAEDGTKVCKVTSFVAKADKTGVADKADVKECVESSACATDATVTGAEDYDVTITCAAVKVAASLAALALAAAM